MESGSPQIVGTAGGPGQAGSSVPLPTLRSTVVTESFGSSTKWWLATGSPSTTTTARGFEVTELGSTQEALLIGLAKTGEPSVVLITCGDFNRLEQLRRQRDRLRRPGLRNARVRPAGAAGPAPDGCATIGCVNDRRPFAPGYIDVDLWSPASFKGGPPYRAFATLRREAPVAWHPEPPRRAGGRPGPGFWCVTKHADIHTVSTDPETYSSWLGGFTGADISGAVLEETRLNLMAMDPPDHTALRKAIREPFSAGGVARLASTIEEIAHDVVDAIAAKGAIEFVDEVASEIPLRIPRTCSVSTRPTGARSTPGRTRIIGNHDPEYGGTIQDFLAAKDALFAHGQRVIAEKRANPGDDFISRVAHADIDGVPIDDDRITMMWYLFLAAANETTRSSLTGDPGVNRTGLINATCS